MGEDDVDFEVDEELGDIDAAKTKLKKLKDELEKVKKERQEYLDGWQRCKADAINARKDTESKAARTAELLREALVHDIIPALDSFDMAAEGEAWGAIDEGWRSGMERVRDQLIEALKRHGIERYGKVGENEGKWGASCVPAIVRASAFCARRRSSRKNNLRNLDKRYCEH